MILPINTKNMSVGIQPDDAAVDCQSKPHSEMLPALRLCRGGLVRINRRRSRPSNRRSEFRKSHSWDDLEEPSSPIRSSTSTKFMVPTGNDFRPIRPRRSSVTMMGGYDQCESLPTCPWSPVRGYQADVTGDAVPVKPRRSSLPAETHIGESLVFDEGDTCDRKDNSTKDKRPRRVKRASTEGRRDACPVMPRRSSLAGLDVARKSIFCSATA